MPARRSAGVPGHCSARCAPRARTDSTASRPATTYRTGTAPERDRCCCIGTTDATGSGDRASGRQAGHTGSV